MTRAMWILIAALAFWGVPMGAQQAGFAVKGSGLGKRLVLPGLVLILEDDEQAGEVRLAARVELPGAPEEYASLDLQEGDALLLLDGTPVADAEELLERYGKAEVGREVALGLRREGGVRVVTFEKPDPSRLPRMRVIRREDLTREQIEQLKEGGQLDSGDGVTIIRKKKGDSKEEKPPPPR